MFSFCVSSHVKTSTAETCDTDCRILHAASGAGSASLLACVIFRILSRLVWKYGGEDRRGPKGGNPRPKRPWARLSFLGRAAKGREGQPAHQLGSLGLTMSCRLPSGVRNGAWTPKLFLGFYRRDVTFPVSSKSSGHTRAVKSTAAKWVRNMSHCVIFTQRKKFQQFGGWPGSP